jgi:transcriptional regulator with XRE-family HTH domain
VTSRDVHCVTLSTTSERKFGEIGARIRQARLGRGFSQERFAPIIGVTRRHLIRLENGEHHPSAELRDRLAEHTGERADHFSLDEDDEESDPVASLTDALNAIVAAAVAKALSRVPV